MYGRGERGKAGRRIAAVVFTCVATAMALAAPEAAQAAPAVPAPTSGNIHPSVSPCGTSGVSVNWNAANIYISGTIRDSCEGGTYVQLFLAWDSGSCPANHCNKKVGTAGSGSGATINWGTATSRPGNILVTLCEHYNNGWHCGYGIPA